jgi:hypothetical protein
MLDSLVFFLILWVALMPDRLGYDEGASRRSKEEGYVPAPLLHHLHHLLPSQKLE